MNKQTPKLYFGVISTEIKRAFIAKKNLLEQIVVQGLMTNVSHYLFARYLIVSSRNVYSRNVYACEVVSAPTCMYVFKTTTDAYKKHKVA